jgi:hypothetical protein
MLVRDLFFSLLAIMALAFLTGPGPWALFLYFCFLQSCHDFACLEGSHRSLATRLLSAFCFSAFCFCFSFVFALR